MQDKKSNKFVIRKNNDDKNNKTTVIKKYIFGGTMNKKNFKKILSFAVLLAMLISSLPLAYAKGEAWMLYENYFDSANDVVNSGFVTYEGENQYALTDSNYSDGNLKCLQTGYLRLDKDISDKVTDDSIIVYESRNKIYPYNKNDNPLYSSQTRPLFIAGNTAATTGARIYIYNGDLYLTFAHGGNAESKGDNHKFADDYTIDQNEYYTYIIKYDNKNDKVKAIVSNEKYGTAESDWISFPYVNNFPFNFKYSGHSSWYYRGNIIDYYKIYDESKMPKATVSGDTLTSLKNGDTATVSLDSAITQETLNKNPITINSGASVSSVLSSDGKKITLTFSNIEMLKSYTLTVPALGENKGTTVTLKGADYEYMLYRAEFDTNNDLAYNDLKVYDSSGSNYLSGWDNSHWLTGGYLTIAGTQDHRLTVLNPDISSKLSSDSMVIYEVRAKHSAGKASETVSAATVDYNSYPVFAAGTKSKSAGARMFGVSGGLGFSTTAGGSGASAEIEDYPIKRGEFYTYKITWDKANNSVKFFVENETQGSKETEWKSFNGTSFDPDWLMLNSSQWFMGSEIDYVRIYDATLVPAPEVTDGDVNYIKNGLEITLPIAVTQADIDEKPVTINGGASVTTTLSADGKKLTLSFSDIELKNAYTLSIPAWGINKAVDLSVMHAVELLGKDASDDNVRTDKSITFSFSDSLGSSSGIKVTTKDGENVNSNAVLSEDGKTITLEFTKGLLYNKEYSVDMSELFSREFIKNAEDAFDFKTEAYPVFVKAVNASLSSVSVSYENKAGIDKTAKLIVIFYNSDGLTVGLAVKDITFANGGSSLSVNSLNKPEGASAAKAYVFESLETLSPVTVSAD